MWREWGQVVKLIKNEIVNFTTEPVFLNRRFNFYEIFL